MPPPNTSVSSAIEIVLQIPVISKCESKTWQQASVENRFKADFSIEHPRNGAPSFCFCRDFLKLLG